MTKKNNDLAVHYSELRDLEARAYAMRAEAIADLIFGVSRGIANAARAVTSAGGRVARKIASMREIDRIYGELSYMTDRDLADIGLSRSDIRAVANGTYERPVARSANVVEANVVEMRPNAKDTARSGGDAYNRAA